MPLDLLLQLGCLLAAVVAAFAVSAAAGIALAHLGLLEPDHRQASRPGARITPPLED